MHYMKRGIKAGALGGKLLGAGGGGYLVFYVQPEKRQDVKDAMSDLLHVPFKFERRWNKDSSLHSRDVQAYRYKLKWRHVC